MTRLFTFALLLAVAVPFSFPAQAVGEAAATNRHAVQFAKGKSSAQLRGTIKGDGDVEYTVSARARCLMMRTQLEFGETCARPRLALTTEPGNP